MRHFVRACLAVVASIIMFSTASAQSSAEKDVRVIVPDVPGGVIVSNCYRAVGRIYSKYTFEFCLKQRATYRVTGGGVRCNGRLTWDVSGIYVQARLRRTSCGNGVAWSADRFSCRPSLVLSLISALLKQDRPVLENLACDYTPARGTGEEPISFIARRR